MKSPLSSSYPNPCNCNGISMMNVIALAFLLSYFGALVVLVPEPHLTRRVHGSYGPPTPSGMFRSAWQAAKEGTQNAVCDQEPCPSTMDKVKETILEGYDKTVEGMESAKDTVKDVYQQAKHGVNEKAEQAKQVIQEKAGQAKHGMHETGEKVASSIPIKEDAASYIPGRETGKAAIEGLKTKTEEAKERAYMLSKEAASSYIPGKESMESIKKSVQETTRDMQERALDAAQQTARDAAASSMPGVSDEKGFKEKVGSVFHGVKERLTGGEDRGGHGDGDGLTRRVHELCSWFEDGSEIGDSRAVEEGVHSAKINVAASRESYAYLMESAMGAIERARKVFEKAVEVNRCESKEKYMYLADSAKGALQAAKEVFERAAAAAEGDTRAPSNMTRLKDAAKKRLSATFRPLLRALYLATFSAVYGATLWMTFLSGYLLSRALPRQQLGLLQSKLFPVYLRLATGCLAVCAAVHAALHPWRTADRWEHWQYGNFALSLGTLLLNTLVVEPRATKIIFEKLKVEKEEGRGQSGGDELDEATKARIASIDAKLKRFHQIASCLNLATVAGLTWHLWYFSNMLAV